MASQTVRPALIDSWAMLKITSGLVVFRLFVLWNRSRLVMYALAAAFAAYEACVIALAVVMVVTVQRTSVVHISVVRFSFEDVRRVQLDIIRVCTTL